MCFRRLLIIAVISSLLSELQFGNAYKILAICPSPTTSHQVVFRGLTVALNKRGHELVVATANPINDSSLKNYTEIDLSFGYDMLADVNYISIGEQSDWFTMVRGLNSIFVPLVDRILHHPDLRQLYAKSSHEKFDLVIVEMFYWPSIYPLGKRFDAPIIGVTSLGLSLHLQYSIGDPILSSHEGNWELAPKILKPMSFWRRLTNFIVAWKHVHWYHTTYMSQHQAIARKHFGDDISDLNDLEKRVSLIFVNQQGPISYARPTIPKVMHIGGFNVVKHVSPLPKDLQKMFDESTQGFVYMSLGGTVKSSMLPQKTINQFVAAFSKLPYKVLWKFEEDVLPGKPDNVHIMKWVPQQAVLAHPNLKVFVYQGGLQSTEEAVAHAVPLIGFPAIGDQEMQVRKMASLGVALKMDLNAVNVNELIEAITTVANDPGYRQRMLSLHSVMEDKPYDPLANAIWWTEHVIRHKGAPYLHSSTADEPWYSRQDMDIVAFISATSVLCGGLLSLMLSKLFKVIIAALHVNAHPTKEKIK